jgi:cell division septum initiation protein DivIVA
MDEINLNKKSLSPEEVRQYIELLKRDYEKSLSEQKDRIFELREKNKELEEKLEVFKSRSRQITQALLAAVAKAEELEQAARLKYDMEIKGLKMFHAKWLSYYKKIIEKYPIDDELVKIARFIKNMSEALGLDGEELTETVNSKNVTPEQEAQNAIEAAKARSEKEPNELQYEAEKERLNQTQKEFNPLENIKKYYQSKFAFSLEEALHPTETLEEILKDLL